MEGKKVALIEVEGEATARNVVEVALVNQLLRHGSFQLVTKEAVQAARLAPEQKPDDWQGIARRAGADYALRARVLEFDGDTRTGIKKVVVEDSQMAAERGEKERMTERLVKAKSLTAKVRVQLEFANLAKKDPRIAVAEHEETVEADEEHEAIHLPPKLRFLEKVANDAFGNFFEKYAD